MLCQTNLEKSNSKNKWLCDSSSNLHSKHCCDCTTPYLTNQSRVLNLLWPTIQAIKLCFFYCVRKLDSLTIGQLDSDFEWYCRWPLENTPSQLGIHMHLPTSPTSGQKFKFTKSGSCVTLNGQLQFPSSMIPLRVICLLHNQLYYPSSGSLSTESLRSSVCGSIVHHCQQELYSKLQL